MTDLKSLRFLTQTALAGCLAIGLAGCDPSEPSNNAGTEASASTEGGPELGEFGVELADMQPDVDPGDNFYRYVNGAWLDTFEIPSERSSYSSFTRLAERSEERIRTIIEEAAENGADAGTLNQKIGDYFASFMDTEAINAAGLAPIEAELERYRTLETHEDVAAVFVDPSLASQAPFGLWVGVDAKQPNQYTVYMSQSGLGLPSRDYYLEEKFADKAVAYQDFLAQMLRFAGVENAYEKASEVYALEERLAQVHWTRAESRDRDKTYNPKTLTQLSDEAGGLPWQSMMAALDLQDQDKFVVRQPSALEGAAEIFEETPVETWKNYLLAHAVMSYASVLPEEIDQASFDFYSRELNGIEEQRPRWKRGVSAVNRALGEAVGKVYVDKHFPPDSKAQMEDLVENLKVAFGERLDTLEWMSDETKEEARAKLAAFTTKIGYPDEWTDYSDLDVVRGDPVGNMRRARMFRFEEMMSKLGGPIDRTEWGMTPQTVNAYYNSTLNEIVFPAAILQAPFFDPEADPAINYGAIGAVIGHEIGHGFDDQGRKSDGSGALRDWWQPEDAQRFEEKADALGSQYASYEPIEGSFINPDLTMGENIGDLGGLSMAYSAYKLATEGEDVPVISGFTGDQRFFLAWAQVWKGLYRDDALRNRLATDSHSPGKYRVNGVVRNMDPWYDAFDVTEDDELYLPPEERVSIW